MAAIMTYNNTVYPCSVDIDCPGVSVCYFFNKTNPNQGYCSCNVEQGSKGLLCDQISPGGYARIVSLSFVLVFAIIAIVVIFYQLLVLNKIKKINIFDVRITSLLMLLISLIFISTYHAVILYWTLYPELSFEEDKLTGKKRRPLSQFRMISLGLNSFFYITASLNISILWLEVAIASKRFKRINKPQLSTNYRYIVFFIDFVFAVVIGFTSWFALSFTSIAAAVIFLIILFL